MFDGLVLGIDPGLTRCGWGVLGVAGPRTEAVACGTLRTSAGLDRGERLLRVHDAVEELLGLHRPGEIALEQVIFNANVSTALGTAQVAGLVSMLGARRHLRVEQYAPTTVKSSVTGFGAAGKAQVRLAVTRILGLDHMPAPDAADALAVALCHVTARNLGRAVAARAGDTDGAQVRRRLEAAITAAEAKTPSPPHGARA